MEWWITNKEVAVHALSECMLYLLPQGRIQEFKRRGFQLKKRGGGVELPTWRNLY